MVKLPPNYKPSESEVYMNDMHLKYFEQKLINWKNELLNTSRSTLETLENEKLNQADLNDQAAMEVEAAIGLTQEDRKRRLINKINLALSRIASKEYGYCEETGDPIGLARLEARPIATLCIDAQERYEKNEKQYVNHDDDDDSDEFSDR